jgi:class 3 adenylate cyclase
MDSLSSYLPASILSFLLENVDSHRPAPFRQDYETVVLFADVSGFTALCEAMAAKGPTGDEQLAKHLNSYFEVLNRTIGSQGGDVFKFAGDAILVVWPPSEEDLTTTTRRAAQCALEIKEKLQDVQLDNGLSLNVKVGVGVGPISILHIGGALKRMEYIATGQPLIQAFESERKGEKNRQERTKLYDTNFD